MNLRTIAAACAALLLFPACFDIEQGIQLEKDLSGKATISMTIDMEPMVYMVAKMKKSMTGDETDPTPEELAAAKKEMLDKKDAEGGAAGDLESKRKEIEADLPEGVKLLDLQAQEDGLKTKVVIVLGFDHISKLSQVDLSKAEGDGPGPNPMRSPFDSFRFVDEGETFVIFNEPPDPVADAEEDADDMPPGMKDEVAKALSTIQITFRIQAPFEVVEHNATEVEGDLLTWTYDATKLEELKKSGEQAGIKARFRK